jgi:hypothetical protein
MRRKARRLISPYSARKNHTWVGGHEVVGGLDSEEWHMKGARHNQSDPMERQIERALCPGESIHDRACFSFVSGLEKVDLADSGT